MHGLIFETSKAARQRAGRRVLLPEPPGAGEPHRRARGSAAAGSVIDLSIYLSIYLSSCLSICLCVYIYIYIYI